MSLLLAFVVLESNIKCHVTPVLSFYETNIWYCLFYPWPFQQPWPCFLSQWAGQQTSCNVKEEKLLPKSNRVVCFAQNVSEPWQFHKLNFVSTVSTVAMKVWYANAGARRMVLIVTVMTKSPVRLPRSWWYKSNCSRQFIGKDQHTTSKSFFLQLK